MIPVVEKVVSSVTSVSPKGCWVLFSRPVVTEAYQFKYCYRLTNGCRVSFSIPVVEKVVSSVTSVSPKGCWVLFSIPKSIVSVFDLVCTAPSKC